jgi:GGDEF domain-containing protein
MTSPPGPRPALLAAVVAALDIVADHVVLLDPAGRVVHVNVAWQRFALDNGAETTDWLGIDYVRASTTTQAEPSSQQDPIAEGLQSVLDGRAERFEHEYDCHAPDELRWFRLLAVRMQLPGVAAIVTHTDITQQRLAERALEHHVTHDRVTGLPNRERLEQQMLQMVQERRTVGAIRIDLAEPGAGPIADEDLAQAATVLGELFPSPAVLGRWSADRLLVVVAGASDDDLAESAEILRATVEVLQPGLGARVDWFNVRGVATFAELDAARDLSPRSSTA